MWCFYLLFFDGIIFSINVQSSSWYSCYYGNSTGLIAVASFLGMLLVAATALFMFLIIGGIPVMLNEQLKEERKDKESKDE